MDIGHWSLDTGHWTMDSAHRLTRPVDLVRDDTLRQRKGDRLGRSADDHVAEKVLRREVSTILRLERTSHSPPSTPHLLPPTSNLTPHISHLTPHTSRSESNPRSRRPDPQRGSTLDPQLTEVSTLARPAPPKVSSVPGPTVPLLVTLRAGVATRLRDQHDGTHLKLKPRGKGKLETDADSRVRPSAVAGSQPPETNGAAMERTCCGERTMSNALAMDEPPGLSAVSAVSAGAAVPAVPAVPAIHITSIPHDTTRQPVPA